MHTSYTGQTSVVKLTSTKNKKQTNSRNGSTKTLTNKGSRTIGMIANKTRCIPMPFQVISLYETLWPGDATWYFP